MRFVHIADVHLGYRQYGYEERAKDFAQAFKKAIEFAEREKPDFILIAGDLFHKKSEMDPMTLAQATIVLERCSVPVIAVEGNHDSTYYREKFTWIDYLASQDLLINLKPRFRESKILLEEWNGRTGAKYDFGDGIIYGMKYYGSLTEKILDLYLSNVRRDGFTIFMSHFGIEGYMNIYGCISSERLYKFKERLDYVALGHIHKKYVEKDFIFNPGSLESCDVREFFYEKGIFVVDYDGELRYRHEKGFYTPRTFRIIELDFTNYNDFREKLKKFDTNEKEVIHLKIKTKENIDRDKIEKIAKEVLDPLALRLEVDYERGIVQALDLNISDKLSIEKNVVKSLLKGFGYEDISEEIIKLKELFVLGNTKAVNSLIEDILSEKIEEAKKVVKKEQAEDEWRWWEVYDQRSSLRKHKKL